MAVSNNYTDVHIGKNERGKRVSDKNVSENYVIPDNFRGVVEIELNNANALDMLSDRLFTDSDDHYVIKQRADGKVEFVNQDTGGRIIVNQLAFTSSGKGQLTSPKHMGFNIKA